MKTRMRSGFTLIELLVVIAIIAILAAILFPVFAQAKTAAKKAVGISNVKQLALAVQMYANDADDVVNPQRRQSMGPANGGSDPSDGLTFEYFLQPYVKSADLYMSNTDSGTKYTSPIGTYRRSYAAVSNAFRGFQGVPGKDGIQNGRTLKVSKAVSWFPSPSETVAIVEQHQADAGLNDAQLWKKQKWVLGSVTLNSRMFPQPAECFWAKEGWLSYGVSNAYNGGGVYGFMDGHAAYKSANGRAANKGGKDGSKCLSTRFNGYEEKAEWWVNSTGYPEYDGGLSCFDSSPYDNEVACKVPGE